ncbi:MAG: dihydrofolate reductase [Lachnospiraceae bacterium]|nr:dihydrofolate reductase [Lachnospiraceae bacterium]
MQAIVTVDNNFSVSYKNNSLASIPAEKKSMMSTVAGKTVVYDIHFIKELLGQQPIRGCNNIIYTAGMKVSIKGASCYETLEEIKEALNKEKNDDIYIIHGADLYNFFFSETDTFHVTKIDYEYNADASIPNLDKDESLEIVADSDELYCFDIIYQFLKYKRK